VAAGQSPAEQSADRTFYFAHTKRAQQMQEVANAIRAIAGIREVSLDNAQKAMAFRGTAGQVELASWLFNELDMAAGGVPAVPQIQNPPTYRLTSGGVTYEPATGIGNDVVRVYHLGNTATPQGLQEIINGMRSLGDLQRVMAYFEPSVITARGTADQIALADWLIHELDKPADAPAPAPQPHEYRMAGSSGVVRVFYLTKAGGAQSFQEIVNEVRRTTNLPRVIGYPSQRAVALRGTNDQAAAAEQVIQELDKR